MVVLSCNLSLSTSQSRRAKPPPPSKMHFKISWTLTETIRMFQSPCDSSIEPGARVGKIAYDSTDAKCTNECIL